MADKPCIGSEHAAYYSKFRPVTPIDVITKIITFLNEKIASPLQDALDVGCGSGQSTAKLAPYFQKVIGIDTSDAQINEARKNNTLPNVEYRTGPAEKLPLESGSLQLVTASQSAHWFNLPEFYLEVDRLLVPFGVLALYGYSLPLPIYSNESKTKKAEKIIKQFYHVDMGSYYSHPRDLVDNNYKDVTLPYEDNMRTTVINEVKCTLSDYYGYIKSWSTYHTMKAKDPEKAELLMNKLHERLNEALEAPSLEMPITLRTEYFILMGRKKG